MILGFLQRNEVNSSQAMEKEGLRRCLNNMDDDGLFAETLVTDRHLALRSIWENGDQRRSTISMSGMLLRVSHWALF